MDRKEFEKKLEELVKKMQEKIEKIDRKTFTKCTCIDYDYSLCPGCQAFADAKNDVERIYNAKISLLKNEFYEGALVVRVCESCGRYRIQGRFHNGSIERIPYDEFKKICHMPTFELNKKYNILNSGYYYCGC